MGYNGRVKFESNPGTSKVYKKSHQVNEYSEILRTMDEAQEDLIKGETLRQRVKLEETCQLDSETTSSSIDSVFREREEGVSKQLEGEHKFELPEGDAETRLSQVERELNESGRSKRIQQLDLSGTRASDSSGSSSSSPSLSPSLFHNSLDQQSRHFSSMRQSHKLEQMGLASNQSGSKQQESVKKEAQVQQQQQQQQQQQHNLDEGVKQVELFGVQIVALIINGKDRLCLAQISNTLLKGFSYNEIHNRRVALGITCVQCTPIQLEMLRRAGAMPSSSRRCGMITMREAERLCRSFLVEEQPPELPENFYFNVSHRINYGCRGRFVPARYISSRAKCIECFYCGDFFSPNKFIFHSHRQPQVTECNPPDSPNINSWRKHIDLDWNMEHNQETRYAWEDVKSLFNGGTRRRIPSANLSIQSSESGKLLELSQSNNPRRHQSIETADKLNATEDDQLIDVDGDDESREQPDLTTKRHFESRHSSSSQSATYPNARFYHLHNIRAQGPSSLIATSRSAHNIHAKTKISSSMKRAMQTDNQDGQVMTKRFVADSEGHNSHIQARQSHQTTNQFERLNTSNQFQDLPIDLIPNRHVAMLAPGLPEIPSKTQAPRHSSQAVRGGFTASSDPASSSYGFEMLNRAQASCSVSPSKPIRQPAPMMAAPSCSQGDVQSLTLPNYNLSTAFLYNQLCAQLTQRSQQQNQTGLTNSHPSLSLDAQIAFKHQFWSSLLARDFSLGDAQQHEL